MPIACSEQPERKTSAVVVNIAAAANPRWDTDKVQVTARSSSGLIATKNMPLAGFNCQVGDTIQASVRAIALTLDKQACTR